MLDHRRARRTASMRAQPPRRSHATYSTHRRATHRSATLLCPRALAYDAADSAASFQIPAVSRRRTVTACLTLAQYVLCDLVGDELVAWIGVPRRVWLVVVVLIERPPRSSGSASRPRSTSPASGRSGSPAPPRGSRGRRCAARGAPSRTRPLAPPSCRSSPGRARRSPAQGRWGLAQPACAPRAGRPRRARPALEPPDQYSAPVPPFVEFKLMSST